MMGVKRGKRIFCEGEGGGNTGYHWENCMKIRIMHDLTRSFKFE